MLAAFLQPAPTKHYENLTAVTCPHLSTQSHLVDFVYHFRDTLIKSFAIANVLI